MDEINKDDIVSLLENNQVITRIPEKIPLLPVRDVVVFSDMVIPLFIGRDKSVKAIESAMNRDRLLFLAAQKDPSIEDPKPKDIYTTGTVSKILKVLKLPDGHFKVLIHGIEKGKIKRFISKNKAYNVAIEIIKDIHLKKVDLEHQALMKNVREQCEKILTIRGEYSSDIGILLDEIEHPGKLADLVTSNLKLKVEEAQQLLELTNPIERLRRVNNYLAREVNLSIMQAKIQSNVRDEISKSQRDYYLREQMRAINKELGEHDEKTEEINSYKINLKRAKLPESIKTETGKQLKRLEQMHPDSSEASVIRTYLDWIVELPWSKSTNDVLDIPKAKKILDSHHYGLDNIKDRILEYLSVRKLNPNKKGQILCFVGPPGVGKTSLGQAIAKAMNRKFFRVSLGGIHDEAEIRGHRKTYIGAMPGCIIQGLKQCGSNNPVFMMDEVDKIGVDYRGDPSSALLEALDPEQNKNFSDHYLKFPFDLSNVLFIVTANVTDTIPSALLDRMEVLNLPGYTTDEKEKVVKKYLLPRQLTDNGLKKDKLTISSKALRQIIEEYTSEAGLRNLERELGTICRKVARKIAEGQTGSFHITQLNLHKYLGVPKYLPEMDQEESQIGLSTGLAWTSVGGEVLYIEASLLPGKGELIITGQLGDIMQESARAAVSFARSYCQAYGIKKKFFENLDIHIHVPAGAIPKDGPSAGIAMAMALISTIIKKAVNTDVAMTGEITLRGRVLPIGGLREKSLGALRAGIKTIIFPDKNRKDLDEIPKNVKRKIKFVPVTTMDEAIKIAIGEIALRVPSKKVIKRIHKS